MPGTVFTGRDGPARIADEITKVFKDTSTYFISVGIFLMREEAQARRDELASSRTSIEGLQVYPPWAERHLYSVGSNLMTLANARKLVKSPGSKIPPGSPITRFY